MANTLDATEVTVVRPSGTVSPTGYSHSLADYQHHMISTDDGTDDPCRECANG
jgi:hypothetical protein